MPSTANQQGFALIEVMMVIAVIGILAAIAIPNFISYRSKAYCSGVSNSCFLSYTNSNPVNPYGDGWLNNSTYQRTL